MSCDQAFAASVTGARQCQNWSLWLWIAGYAYADMEALIVCVIWSSGVINMASIRQGREDMFLVG